MIHRLLTTLPAVGALPASRLRDESSRRLLADCADALRLELDCPQQSLTPAQRSSLLRLSDLLEADGAPPAELAAAARDACAALGLRVRGPDERPIYPGAPD